MGLFGENEKNKKKSKRAASAVNPADYIEMDPEKFGKARRSMEELLSDPRVTREDLEFGLRSASEAVDRQNDYIRSMMEMIKSSQYTVAEVTELVGESDEFLALSHEFRQRFVDLFVAWEMEQNMYRAEVEARMHETAAKLPDTEPE